MKKRNSLVYVVLSLALVLAMSMVFVGCDNDKVEPEKPENEYANMWEGDDLTDGAALWTKLKTEAKKNNFRFYDSRKSVDSPSDYYMLQECNAKAYHVYFIENGVKGNEMYCTSDNKTYMADESGKFTVTDSEEEFDVSAVSKSLDNYLFQFDDAEWKYDTESKKLQAILGMTAFDVTLSNTGMTLSSEHDGFNHEIAVKMIGHVNIVLPKV